MVLWPRSFAATQHTKGIRAWYMEELWHRSWMGPCARKTLERAGFQDFQRLCVGDLGIEKGKSPVTDERVQQVFERASQILALA